MNNDWSDDDTETVRRMWLRGESASTIAMRIRGRTRSAVLGKVFRMGLPKRSDMGHSASSRGGRIRAQQISRQRASRRSAAMPVDFRRPDSKIRSLLKQDGLTDLGPDTPPAKLTKLIDLTPSCCRWSYGDPKHSDFGFCGRQSVPGASYCEHHVKRAFEVPKRERKPAAVEETVNPKELELT